MKKLVCELCGSTDLIKKDGVYVCESCGGKFSVEEARKMMVEGTVNVQGTVQIDDSNRLENYFVQAETEYEAGNSEKAAAYCDKILENNVRYAKAWFLKGKIEADENYFKKAIEYAAETSEANKLEMEQKIGAWLTDYIIQIFKRTDDLEKIALRILCLESFEDTVSRSYVDMHKIKQAVQSYLMHSFDLDFEISDHSSISFERFEPLKYSVTVCSFFGVLEKFDLIDENGYDAFAGNLSKKIMRCLSKAEDKFIKRRYDQQGKNYESEVHAFKEVWLCLQLLFDAVYEKSKTSELKSACNEMEKRLPYFLDINWYNGRDSFVFSDSYKEEMRAKIEKYKKVLFAVKNEVEDEKSDGVLSTEDKTYTFVCEKCEQEFSFKKSEEIYDDEKGTLVCPYCGHINLKSEESSEGSEPKYKDSSDENKDAENTDAKPTNILLNVTILWVVAEIILGGILFKESSSDRKSYNSSSYNFNSSYSDNKYSSNYKSSYHAPTAQEIAADKANMISAMNEKELRIETNRKVYTSEDKISLNVYFEGVSYVESQTAIKSLSTSEKDEICAALRTETALKLAKVNLEVKSDYCLLGSGSDKFKFRHVDKYSSSKYGYTLYADFDSIVYTAEIEPQKQGKFELSAFSYNDLKSAPLSIYVLDKNVLLNAVKDIDLKKLKELSEEYDVSAQDISAMKIDGQNGIFYMLKQKPEKTSEIVRFIDDVNMTDEQGTSLLSLAVARENNTLINWILTKNVDVNYIDKKGRTALMYAAIKGNLSAAQKLLDHNADIYLSRDGQWNAYKYAVEFKHNQTAKLVKPKYDELIFFEHDCATCKDKKQKFKTYVADYPTLKIKYVPVSRISEYMADQVSSYPVVLAQNSKTDAGMYQAGWNGQRESLQNLLR